MKDFDRVRKYLDEHMSIEERTAFEAELAREENVDLRKELETQRIERAAIRLLQEDQMRAVISEVQAEFGAEASTTPVRTLNRRTFFFSVAAAILLLCMVGIFVGRNQYSDQSLAQTNYAFSLSYLRSSPSSGDPLEKGKSLFEEGKYDAAIREFSQLDTLPVQASYLTGHAYFQANQYQQATSTFKGIISMGSDAGYFEPDAKWFFILSKLAMKQFDQDAQEILQELVAARDPRALKLDRQLGSWFRVL